MSDDAIRIVLCRPSHAGNIGGAARALRVMGLSELVLVSPREFPHQDATARATGAEDVLTAARVVDRLEDAVGDCVFVVGLSARDRHQGPALLDVADAARQAVVRSATGRVAFVFGNERTGMTNEELNACHAVASIPTGPYISSLNLASAVQVVSYELNRARRGLDDDAARPPSAPPQLEADASEPPATRSAIDTFLTRLWLVLDGRPKFDPEDVRIMRLQERLRRLLDRAGPTEAEMRAAHGVLSWFEAPNGKIDREG